MQNTIDQIIEHHRRRCFFMRERIRFQHSLTSYVRFNEGWRLDAPLEERKRIDKYALDVFKGKVPAGKYEREVEASKQAIRCFEVPEDEAERAMGKLAETLPVWESFAKGIRMFSAARLATVVGEAGDLANYPTKAHLWKRLGLGIVDGNRQGGKPPAGLSKEDQDAYWIEHGYNRERRAKLWVIGDLLIKAGAGSPYYDAYIRRKEYEQLQATMRGLQVVPAAKIPAKQKDEFISEGHIHLRAKRYMEKRLVRDLRREWLAADHWKGADKANAPMSATEPV